MGNDMFIDDMKLTYEADNSFGGSGGMHHLQLSILTKLIPKDYDDVFKILADQYLRSKGIKLSLDEMIETHYPEMLI